MNVIRSISVPVDSEASRLLSQWADDGENVSENCRRAIEGFVRMDTRERRMLALEWTLAECGVCPCTLEPPTPHEAASMHNNPVWAVYSRHRCELCEEGLDMWTYRQHEKKLDRSGKWRVEARRRQEVLGPLVQQWRDNEAIIMDAHKEGLI